MLAVVPGLIGEAAKDHPLPDEEIVRRVLAGEKALYEVLMRRHNRKLYRAVRSILKDEDEVEGVMQQAYVSTYFHLDQFRGAARFSTWLIRIAVHEAFARKRRSRRFAGGDVHDLMMCLPSKDRNPEERASDRELGGVLQEAIDRLPTSYRSVFVMREVEGLGTTETAECLGVSAENVKVRLHRARRRLQNEIHARVGTGVEAVLPFHAPRCDRVVAAVFAALQRMEEANSS
jgi:RNA polymerase sigma-70 factor, ECF subfamily